MTILNLLNPNILPFYIMKKNSSLSKPEQVAIAISSTCGEKQSDNLNFHSLKNKLMLNREQERRFNSILKKYETKRKLSMNNLIDGDSGISCTMVKMTELIKHQNAEVALVLNPEQFRIYSNSIQKIETKLQPPGYSNELIKTLIIELKLNEEQSQTLIAVNKAFERLFIDARRFYQEDEDMAKEYWDMYDTERKCAIKLMLNKYKYDKYLKLVSEETYKSIDIERIKNKKKTKYNLC